MNTYNNPQSAFPSNINSHGVNLVIDRAAVIREVKSGLQNERTRIMEAFENLAFYLHEGLRWMPRRGSEGQFDWQSRPHRDSGFTRQLIEVLCDHLYNPGPKRTHIVPAANDYLELVYETTHIDAVMHEAEKLSSLNNVAAIQVEATGDPDSPIRLHLWGSEEFHVFCHPDDPTKPCAVVTIDRFNGQTRYRLWFHDLVYTYMTRPVNNDTTSGGRIAWETPESPEENTYGIIPFAFVHYSFPVRDFWTPGVGSFIRAGQVRIDTRLSALDESLQRHLDPWIFAYGVDPLWNPVIQPGLITRVPTGSANLSSGDYSPGVPPRIEALQPSIDIVGAWEDAKNFANQVMEAIRVPPGSVRMDTNQVGSGIQLVVEQAPLLKRAKSRRHLFTRFEQDLARVILIAAGTHYGRPDLVGSAKRSANLSLSWPEPTIPIPGPDRDQADQWEYSIGLVSRLELLERRRGLSRDQAIAELKRIADDERIAQDAYPLGPPLDQPHTPTDPIDTTA